MRVLFLLCRFGIKIVSNLCICFVKLYGGSAKYGAKELIKLSSVSLPFDFVDK